MLEFSDKAKIALADGLIKYINKRRGYTGVSDQLEEGVREVHIDFEDLEENLVLGQAVCDAIAAACAADDVDFDVD